MENKIKQKAISCLDKISWATLFHNTNDDNDS